MNYESATYAWAEGTHDPIEAPVLTQELDPPASQGVRVDWVRVAKSAEAAETAVADAALAAAPPTPAAPAEQAPLAPLY